MIYSRLVELSHYNQIYQMKASPMFAHIWGMLLSVREIILFHLVQRLKAFRTFGSQSFRHSDGQHVQQGGGGRHGVLLLLSAPVSEQADSRPLLLGRQVRPTKARVR